MTDMNALLNPPWDPGPIWARIFDHLSWVLPILAGLLSVGAVLSFHDIRVWCGVAAGIISAGGVIFTGLASRVRDGRLAVAQATASLGIGLADAISKQSTGFGG